MNDKKQFSEVMVYKINSVLEGKLKPALFISGREIRLL